MENLYFYRKVASPPKEVLKKIEAGRLRGMTDIKPQWRLEIMTEIFGPVGVGWKFEIVDERIIDVFDNQKFVKTNINVFIKVDDVWSDAIPGTGGDMLVIKEKNGLYCNDEAFKMALTDALSNAMRNIGVAADVYIGLHNSQTKYDRPQTAVKRVITTKDVKLWNGKIYDDKFIYINNEFIEVEATQLDKLKKLDKFKKE